MKTLQLIGRKGDLCSNIRVSVLSLQRLTGFFGQVLADKGNSKELRGRVRTLEHYLDSLGDHSSFVSQKVTFLLDATLGMINIEQSNIIKIFSIAAGVFSAADADRLDLRHELLVHAGAALGLRLSVGRSADARVRAAAVLVLQAARLALTAAAFSSNPCQSDANARLSSRVAGSLPSPSQNSAARFSRSAVAIAAAGPKQSRAVPQRPPWRHRGRRR